MVEERERGLHGDGERADPAENEAAEAGAAAPMPTDMVGGEADRRVAGDGERVGEGLQEGEAERRDDHVDAAVGEAVAKVERGGAAERGDERNPAVVVDEGNGEHAAEELHVCDDEDVHPAAFVSEVGLYTAGGGDCVGGQVVAF